MAFRILGLNARLKWRTKSCSDLVSSVTNCVPPWKNKNCSFSVEEASGGGFLNVPEEGFLNVLVRAASEQPAAEQPAALIISGATVFFGAGVELPFCRSSPSAPCRPENREWRTGKMNCDIFVFPTGAQLLGEVRNPCWNGFLLEAAQHVAASSVDEFEYAGEPCSARHGSDNVRWIAHCRWRLRQLCRCRGCLLLLGAARPGGIHAPAACLHRKTSSQKNMWTRMLM